jgi:hypothetical protein
VKAKKVREPKVVVVKGEYLGPCNIPAHREYQTSVGCPRYHSLWEKVLDKMLGAAVAVALIAGAGLLWALSFVAIPILDWRENRRLSKESSQAK